MFLFNLGYKVLGLEIRVQGLRVSGFSVYSLWSRVSLNSRIQCLGLRVFGFGGKIYGLVPSLIEGLQVVQGLRVVPVFLYRYSMKLV